LCLGEDAEAKEGEGEEGFHRFVIESTKMQANINTF
jgi:hypothetical protein